MLNKIDDFDCRWRMYKQVMGGDRYEAIVRSTDVVEDSDLRTKFRYRPRKHNYTVSRKNGTLFIFPINWPNVDQF